MTGKIIKKISGLFFIALSLFILMAVISHNSMDPSFNRAVEPNQIYNLSGIYGAYISDLIVQLLGHSGLIPIVFLLSIGVHFFNNNSYKLLPLKISTIILSTMIFSFLFAASHLIYETLPNGGFLGGFLYNEISMQMDSSKYIWPLFFFTALLFTWAMNINPNNAIKLLSIIIKNLVLVYAVFSWIGKTIFAFVFRGAAKFSHEKIEEQEYPNFPDAKQITKIVSNVKISPEKKQVTQPIITRRTNSELPSTQLLKEPDKLKKVTFNEYALSQNSKILQQVLDDFGIKGEVQKIHPGPVVTLYEFEPSAGTKSSRIIGLADDIARSMSAISARIAVISGKSSLGIELPNAHREIVLLRELLESKVYLESDNKLPLILGKNIAGESIVADLAKMPHLLVAGTTGSGKSVAINTMILSLLYRHSPDDCKFIMIDPKMLELSVYDGIPHLLAPVVTEPKKAVSALKWVVKEMENRYKLMSTLGVRNIDGYNTSVGDAIKNGLRLDKKIQVGFNAETGEPKFETIEIELKKLPFIVVIVDEMADLMLVAGKEIEGSIQRLAQMARAAGIHIIMATQRPSVDVITGVIKANFPTRISFQVTSRIDSRTILGEQGAEQLLGMGDMLFMRGGGRIERVHGPFVDDKEVEKITTFLKEQGAPTYIENITADEDEEFGGGFDGESSGDDVYDQAIKIVLRDKKASISYIQRCLRVGYNKAATIIERMEREGIVSAPNHVGKREILLNNDE